MEPLHRVTPPTLDVLETGLASDDGPVWGLVIITRTGRPSGTIYPILERLERQGWITGAWEAEGERSGPRRRHYAFTAEGREAATELMTTAAARRRAAAARPSRAATGRPGGARRPVEG
jgi:PadR family transcriptional regulator PadR